MRIAAPTRQPAPSSRDTLILRDGSVVTIRTAGPSDRPALRAFIDELSPESRRQRFLCSGWPPDSVIAELCQQPDPARGVTLLAVRAIDGSEHILGTASYFRVEGAVAEAAFVVAEHFEGNGIATGLLERLADAARAAGFDRFQATTFAGNGPMLDVFRESGFTIRSKLDSGGVNVELLLAPSEQSVAASQERERSATAASIRPLLEPHAVAVIGVSRDAAGLGRRIFDALNAGGFDGPLFAVNPKAGDIAGRAICRSVRDLPAGVDLAVVAVPRDAVLSTIDDCAAAGVKSLVVITAGFAETGLEGRTLQRAMVDRVRGYGMRMIGPNCMGLLNTHRRLNASFSPVFPPEGRVALSSQSGALGIAILALASERAIGLSSFVSVGNKADVSGNDLLQYWESDPGTAVILLYLESFGNPRRFARLARRIARTKPIVAVKAGRTRAGSRAAGSHTAALAANEVAVEALFHQAGVIRADTIDEMFDIAACLESQPLPAGRRVAVVTNAGGPGILAVDACEAAGLIVSEFSEETRASLRQFLPSAASVGNPVDMVASAGPDAFRQSIEVVIGAKEVDAVIVIYTPIDASCTDAILAAIREGIVAGRRAGAQDKPILACLMAEAGRPRPLACGDERIPAYSFPENAARALAKASAYAQWRRAPAGLCWTFNDIQIEQARDLCRQVAGTRGQTWLTAEELRRLLDAFGLPVVPATLARTAVEAAELAAVVGFPVAAKLSFDLILHKSNMGGVRLNLSTPEEVGHAFTELMALAADLTVSDPTGGVLIQPMITGGTEIMVGLVEDPLFGPIVGVGLGGTQVEVLGDIHFRMAPLTDRDADELVHQMRGFALLNGYRGRPLADIDALTDVVLRVSRMAEEIPEIVELDLNPVIVLSSGTGCWIVDARVRVGKA